MLELLVAIAGIMLDNDILAIRFHDTEYSFLAVTWSTTVEVGAVGIVDLLLNFESSCCVHPTQMERPWSYCKSKRLHLRY